MPHAASRLKLSKQLCTCSMRLLLSTAGVRPAKPHHTPDGFWTQAFGPRLLDLGFWARAFGPGLLDPGFWTWAFEPRLLNPGFWTRAFGPGLLNGPELMDPSFWARASVPRLLDPGFWARVFGPEPGLAIARLCALRMRAPRLPCKTLSYDLNWI